MVQSTEDRTCKGLKTAQCNEACSEGSTLLNKVCLKYEQEIKLIWVEVCFVHASKACTQSRGITQS